MIQNSPWGPKFKSPNRESWWGFWLMTMTWHEKQIGNVKFPSPHCLLNSTTTRFCFHQHGKSRSLFLVCPPLLHLLTEFSHSNWRLDGSWYLGLPFLQKFLNHLCALVWPQRILPCQLDVLQAASRCTACEFWCGLFNFKTRDVISL